MFFRKLLNSFWVSIFVISFSIIMLILSWAIISVFYKGLQSFEIRMLILTPKAVGESGGGFANALVGSLIICGGAILCFSPFAILIGIFLAQYPYTRLARLVNILVNSINSVPSIVLGIISYLIFVKPFKIFNAWSAIFAIGIIYLPYVVAYTQEAISKMSGLYMEQALALGLSKFKSIIFLILRFSKGMIIFGMLSGLARIIGESAPLLFTALGNDAVFEGFTKPISALPLLIFSYAISPFEAWRSIAWAAAFVTTLLVLILNLAISFTSKQQYE
jgi:phosphate transport system permease protein